MPKAKPREKLVAMIEHKHKQFLKKRKKQTDLSEAAQIREALDDYMAKLKA